MIINIFSYYYSTVVCTVLYLLEWTDIIDGTPNTLTCCCHLQSIPLSPNHTIIISASSSSMQQFFEVARPLEKNEFLESYRKV